MTMLLSMLFLMVFQQPESKPIPKDSVEIETHGCLKGRVFTATGAPEGEGVRRGPDVIGRHFRIAGPRDLMDLVKTHNGQYVAIVGIVRKSALADEGIGIKVGGARVVIGAPGNDPSRMNAPPAARSVATMDLTAIRPVSERCPIG